MGDQTEIKKHQENFSSSAVLLLGMLIISIFCKGNEIMQIPILLFKFKDKLNITMSLWSIFGVFCSEVSQDSKQEMSRTHFKDESWPNAKKNLSGFGVRRRSSPKLRWADCLQSRRLERFGAQNTFIFLRKPGQDCYATDEWREHFDGWV